jgi:pseudaminic acid cytidylyltransferase
MKCLAIIPARGGSVRIPRKNIKNFCGKPIITYSIETALTSQCFDEVMVSTEDDEIAQITQAYGAKVPFRRSLQAADDQATLVDVVEEVVTNYQKRGSYFDYVCCILATAPFASTHIVQKSYEILINQAADAVIPVVQFDYPIQRGLEINNKLLRMIWPENYAKRSQDLMPTYHDAGLFYWMNVKSLRNQKCFYMKKSCPLVVSPLEAHDIDTPLDWQFAELKYKFWCEENKIKKVDDAGGKRTRKILGGCIWQ